MKKRYLTENIVKDLKEKMVFIGGARQVGKTTLALHIAENYFLNYDYLNWDNSEDRKRIIKSQFKGNAGIIIFDEIHKYRNWKNYIKGIYDKYKNKFKIIVTGSSKLDIYFRGGDSLFGRYYYYHLHPFSFNELLGIKPDITLFKELKSISNKSAIKTFNKLYKYGGFPEPLLKNNDKFIRRWHNMRNDRLIKEDIRDIEDIKNLSGMQILADILPEKVGSLLSLNSLREDLEVAHKTITSWMNILEKFYYHFRIYPFKHRKIRSLKKEPKLYLWDWSEINNDGAKLENIIASHILKLCNFLRDAEGYKTELYYIRDVEGREVDFLVAENRKPWFAVEVKATYKQVSKNLMYFIKKMNIPFAYQVVLEEDIDIIENNIRIMSISKFLSMLI